MASACRALTRRNRAFLALPAIGQGALLHLATTQTGVVHQSP
jgi:hypothetical protein